MLTHGTPEPKTYPSTQVTGVLRGTSPSFGDYCILNTDKLTLVSADASAGMEPEHRERIESVLRDRLEAAELEYRLAIHEYSRIAALTSSPENLSALARAADARAVALQAYNTALRQFADFIMEGRVPDDLADET